VKKSHKDKHFFGKKSHVLGVEEVKGIHKMAAALFFLRFGS